jgi:hypothetical protein
METSDRLHCMTEQIMSRHDITYCFLIIMLVKYVLSDGISQAFLPFGFVDVIHITDHSGM